MAVLRHTGVGRGRASLCCHVSPSVTFESQLDASHALGKLAVGLWSLSLVLRSRVCAAVMELSRPPDSLAFLRGSWDNCHFSRRRGRLVRAPGRLWAGLPRGPGGPLKGLGPGLRLTDHAFFSSWNSPWHCCRRVLPAWGWNLFLLSVAHHKALVPAQVHLTMDLLSSATSKSPLECKVLFEEDWNTLFAGWSARTLLGHLAVQDGRLC